MTEAQIIELAKKCNADLTTFDGEPLSYTFAIANLIKFAELTKARANQWIDWDDICNKVHDKMLWAFKQSGLTDNRLVPDDTQLGIEFALDIVKPYFTNDKARWINVNDRLPELVKSDNHETEPMLESERVLTYSPSGYGLDKVYKIGNGKTHFFSEKATHWQYLPPPPNAQQERN